MTLVSKDTVLAAGRWCAAQIKPRQEHVASRHLERQGFAVHCPMVARSRLMRGRTHKTLEPLFPGYLFVAIGGNEQRWRSINSTIAVSRVVAFGEQPALLPEGFVEGLAGLAGADGQVAFEERLSPGDEIRILGGPFDNLCGTLSATGGADRVTVLLQLLSGETKVTLSRAGIMVT